METIKNVLTGLAVVLAAGFAGFAVLQGFGLLYEHTFPSEFFSFTMAPEWGNGDASARSIAILIGIIRLFWGVITVFGPLLMWGSYDLGKAIRAR